MGNPYRGEVTLELAGEARVMRLTLGALAELEEHLGAESLAGLLERFEGGSYSARDLLALLCAGLRGGGMEIDAAQLGQMEIGGGPVAAARAAGQLLARSFTVPE